MTCSAMTTEGIAAVWQTVLDHRRLLSNAGELAARRRDQAIDWMYALVEEGLKNRFYAQPAVKAAIPDICRSVTEGTRNAAAAAEKLLFFLDNSS